LVLVITSPTQLLLHAVHLAMYKTAYKIQHMLTHSAIMAMADNDLLIFLLSAMRLNAVMFTGILSSLLSCMMTLVNGCQGVLEDIVNISSSPGRNQGQTKRNFSLG